MYISHTLRETAHIPTVSGNLRKTKKKQYEHYTISIRTFDNWTDKLQFDIERKKHR